MPSDTGLGFNALGRAAALLLCLYPYGLRSAACSDFPVSPPNPNGVSAVTVGAGTDRFLAAWIDLRAGSTSPALYCATVTVGGSVGQPDGVLLSAGSASRPELSVPARNQIAFDGTNFLVVWRDSRAFYPGANAKATANIVAALVGQDGSLVKGEFLIGTGEGDRADPLVAFNGEKFVAAWTDSRGGSATGKDVYYTFVSVSGDPDPAMGKAWQAFSGDQRLQVLAAGASGEVLCAYLDSGVIPSCIRASRLTKAGTVRDTLGIKLFAHPVTAGDMGLALAAAPSGSDYLVLTGSRKDDNLYQHKLLSNGTVHAATAASPLFNFGGAERTADASKAFVSAGASGWIACRTQPNSSIRAKRVGFDGTDADPALLLLNDAPVSGGRSSPAGAAMGTWYFAAWLDGRLNNAAWSVYGRVFDLGMAGSGGPAAPVPKISASPETGAPPLDVSFDGSASSGNIAAWEWDFGDNSAKKYGAAADHTYANAGVYTVRLKVSDGVYAAYDSSVIVVSAGGGSGNKGGGDVDVGSPGAMMPNVSPDLAVDSAHFALNFRPGKEEEDRITIKGYMSPSVVYACKKGTAVTVLVGGKAFDFSMDDDFARHKAPIGSRPRIIWSLHVEDKTGRFRFVAWNTNLKDDLEVFGAENDTITSPRVVDVPLTFKVGGAVLASTIGFSYTAAEDRKGRGKYRARGMYGRINTGHFVLLGGKAVEKGGEYTRRMDFDLYGRIRMPMGESLDKPDFGEWRITVGEYSDAIPCEEIFVGGGKLKYRAPRRGEDRKTEGILAMDVDPVKGTFKIKVRNVDIDEAAFPDSRSDTTSVNLYVSANLDARAVSFSASGFVTLGRVPEKPRVWKKL